MRVLIVRRVPRKGTRVAAALTTIESVTALVVAHTAAGGELPGLGWLLPAAALVYGASTLVFSRRGSIRVVLPALIAAQLLMHAWLVTLSGTEHAAHAGPLLGMTGPMLAAHLAAGTATALAWALRRRAVDVLTSWADPGPLPVPLLATTVTPEAPYVEHRDRTLTVAPTRGPPEGFALAA